MIVKNENGSVSVKGSPSEAPRSMLEEALHILAYIALTTGPITVPSTLEMRTALRVAKDSGMGFYKIPTDAEESGWVLGFQPIEEKDGTAN